MIKVANLEREKYHSIFKEISYWIILYIAWSREDSRPRMNENTPEQNERAL